MEVLHVSKEFRIKMKIFAVILLNFSVIITGFICAKNSGERTNDRLPDSRPQNIAFRLSYSGGMLYYSENLYISSDSCNYSVNDGGAVSKINFKMTSQELDKLYKVFT